MRSRLSVEERKEQLLDLALELFSQHTYEELSIDAIAEAAGVSKGLLYHYFRNKRAFFVAALRRAADQFYEATEVPVPESGEPTLEEMREGMEKFLAFAEEHEGSYVFLLRGGMAGDQEVMDVIEQTRERFLARMLGNLGNVPAPAQMMLRGCLALAETVSLEWLRSEPREPRTVVAERLVTVFVAAVTAALPSG